VSVLQLNRLGDAHRELREAELPDVLRAAPAPEAFEARHPEELPHLPRGPRDRQRPARDWAPAQGRDGEPSPDASA